MEVLIESLFQLETPGVFANLLYKIFGKYNVINAGF